MIGNQTGSYPGIMIDAEQGALLHAPADGFVYQLQDQDGIATNRMMLVHKNGYITIFTSILEATVKQDEIVRR